jgi:cysteine desulfurase
MCRERGVLFHTDATQRVGRMAVDCSSSTWDLLSFAAHKFHGPKGIGGLFVRRGVRLTPQMAGGPQERHRRGGTENVPGIAGMGVAADLARAWIDGDGPRRQALLRDGFERRLLDSTPLASINGAGSPRSWTTSNVAFRGLEAEVILLMLSERGVCASGGAACSSGSIEPSPVLGAMGVPLSRAAGSVRFSIGRDTTQQELDRGAGIVCEVVHRCFDRAAGAVRA